MTKTRKAPTRPPAPPAPVRHSVSNQRTAVENGVAPTQFDSVSDMYAVSLRIYIPHRDIDAVLEGAHVNGSSLEKAP